jgi:hypothetical protein
MAQELEVTLKLKYEPRPESYLDESKTLSDITPEYMASVDQEEFTEDPGAFIEWLADKLGYEDGIISVKPVDND